MLSGWRAAVVAALVLIIIGALVFGFMILLLPFLLGGVLASMFMPKRARIWRRPTANRYPDVIEGEFREIAPESRENLIGSSKPASEFDEADRPGGNSAS